jgi:predicted ATPase
VIASVAFHNFKALRSARLELAPFNLVIGPSGSGKTSLIEAVLRLQALSRRPAGDPAAIKTDRAMLEFRFRPPFDAIGVRIGCASDYTCDLLVVSPPDAPDWPRLKDAIGGLQAFALDHRSMAQPSRPESGEKLLPNGSNIAAVLASIAERAPAAFGELRDAFVRMLPEFRDIDFARVPEGGVTIELPLREHQDGERVGAQDLAQGTLFTLAMLAIAYDPDPPALVCVEEIDRGIHPRMLREIRDLFYRLSYPETCGARRRPTQVIATTHSPLMVDLFKDHPEEVVITQKHGSIAHFQKLADRPDVPELLREGSLGDIWMSGILGGVPEEAAFEEETGEDGPGTPGGEAPGRE